MRGMKTAMAVNGTQLQKKTLMSKQIDPINREWECQPKSLRDNNVPDDINWETGSFSSEVDIYMGEEEYTEEKQLNYDRDFEGGWEEDGDVEEEDDEERESSDVSIEHFHALRDVFPLLRKGQQTHYNLGGSEAELEYLRDGELDKECAKVYTTL